MTKYYCDVCEKEVGEGETYLVKMAIHGRNDLLVSVSLDACLECTESTGFVKHQGNSGDNHTRVEKSYSIWRKWFKKGR